MVLSFWSDWAGPLPLVTPSLAQTNINLLISKSPSSLKLFFFFFLRGGGRIELQLSLVTDLTAAERRKHSFNNSHICAWYTATEQEKDLGAGGRLFCYSGGSKKTSEQTHNNKKTCCEATFSPPTLLPCQDEDLFRLTCRLVGWPLLCPALRWRKGEFMFTSVAAGEGGGWS